MLHFEDMSTAPPAPPSPYRSPIVLVGGGCIVLCVLFITVGFGYQWLSSPSQARDDAASERNMSFAERMAKHQREGLDLGPVARSFLEAWQKGGASATATLFDQRSPEPVRNLPAELEREAAFRIKEIAGIDPPVGEREFIVTATGERVHVQEIRVHLVKSERLMDGFAPMSFTLFVATDSRKVHSFSFQP